MALRTVIALLSLAVARSAVPTEGDRQLVDSALEGDDECVAGSGECGLNALQRRTGKLETDEGDQATTEGTPEKPAPEETPFHIANNASNKVVLANCHERYGLKPGEKIETTMLVTGGFWVLPAGADFNCSVGCADCFYIAMEWTETEGASARIGFGLKSQTPRPQGGGIRLSVSGAGTSQCTDESCKPGWTDALPVDLDRPKIRVLVVVEGSETAKPDANGTVDAARFGRGIGRRVGRGFRRPIRRRPWRRPIFRRRPIYRPIRRHPIHGGGGGGCGWCNQYGHGTCWWLC